MTTQTTLVRPVTDQTTLAYNHCSEDYLVYADGHNPMKDLFAFKGRQFAHSDRVVWDRISSIFERQLDRPGDSIRVLDVGTGPGTWPARIGHQFSNRGKHIDIVGVDIAHDLIAIANRQLETFYENHSQDDVSITYQSEIDLGRRLPFADNEFDVVLCLFTVMNHLPVNKLRFAASELLRVSQDVVYGTVRSKFGLETAYVCPMEMLSEWSQVEDWLFIALKDGEEFAIRSHLFTCDEMEALFEQATSVQLEGIDVCYTRLQRSMSSSDLVDHPALDEIRRVDGRLAKNSALLQVANHIGFLCTK
jgi:SAM-dependent methyltransferase